MNHFNANAVLIFDILQSYLDTEIPYELALRRFSENIGNASARQLTERFSTGLAELSRQGGITLTSYGCYANTGQPTTDIALPQETLKYLELKRRYS